MFLGPNTIRRKLDLNQPILHRWRCKVDDTQNRPVVPAYVPEASAAIDDKLIQRAEAILGAARSVLVKANFWIPPKGKRQRP